MRSDQLESLPIAVLLVFVVVQRINSSPIWRRSSHKPSAFDLKEVRKVLREALAVAVKRSLCIRNQVYLFRLLFLNIQLNTQSEYSLKRINHFAIFVVLEVVISFVVHSFVRCQREPRYLKAK